MNIMDCSKNEYLFWMNILDFYKMNNFLNKYFGFTLPASKMVAKCLKLIWNHSGIISGTSFTSFQGLLYLYRGFRRAPFFGLIGEFWLIFLDFFYEYFHWICWTLLHEYFVFNWTLNWIIWLHISIIRRSQK